MALAKQGYKSAQQGTAIVKVNLDENGNIAQSGDDLKSTKNFNFTYANAENGLTENASLATVFFENFLGGSYESASQSFRVTWVADE